MAVRSGARTATATLDPEQVVEQGDDEVVMQVAAVGPAHQERHDRKPLGVEVAENLDVGVGLPRPDRTTQESLFLSADHIDADGLLELEHQAGADRVDDRRRATLLAMDRVVEVTVRVGIDVGHGAATGNCWHTIAYELASHDEHSRGARPTQELVWRDEDGVLVGLWVASRIHLDVDVRRGGGEVPQRQGPVSMQHRRDAIRVGHDAGHVGRRGERADAQRPVSVLDQPLFEHIEVDVAVAGLRIRTTSAMDSRHGSSFEWCSNGPTKTAGRWSVGI